MKNKLLKNEINNIHKELGELKYALNMLGDSLSHDNKIRDTDPNYFNVSTDDVLLKRHPPTGGITWEKDRRCNNHSEGPCLFEACHESHAGAPNANCLVLPFSQHYNNYIRGNRGGGERRDFNHIEKNTFLTKDVINKIIPKVFEDLIDKHNLNYDISKEGYNWNALIRLCTDKGLHQEQWSRSIPLYIMENYDISWKSYKDLFGITI